MGKVFLNNEIAGRKLVLFGAGHRARVTVEYYLEWYDIAYICDNDRNKWYTELRGIPIYPPDKLLEENRQEVVVLNTTKLHDKEITKWFDDNEIDYIDDVIISLPKKYLSERCVNRKLLIYGTGLLSEEISAILIKQGFTIDYYIESRSSLTSYMGKPVKHYLDIIFEDKDDIFVILADENESYAESKKRFLQLDMVEDVHFTFHLHPPVRDVICYCDVLLSYNRVKEQLEGFEIFGDPDKHDALKIVALGGSTTESYRETSKSWAPMLVDILADNGISAVLYCGGVDGYNSSQELLKLIRDCIPLKPDVVLSYSGANDIYRYTRAIYESPRLEHRPFVTEFQSHFFDKVMEQYSGVDQTVYYGLENDKKLLDVWIDNIRTMNAIAKEFNILFLSFLQPFYFTGDCNPSPSQKAIFSRIFPSVDYTCLNYSKEEAALMGQYAAELADAAKPYDYIYDLTKVFPAQACVYRDPYHLNEQGNKIIADTICGILLKHLDGGRLK